MAGKIRHLLKRDGRYYARIVIPERLRPFIDGKRELREPLGGDRATALGLHAAAVARLQTIVEAARAKATQGGTPARKPAPRGRPMTVSQMARTHYADQVRFDDEARNADHRYAAGFIDEDYVAGLKRAVTGSASNDEMLATVGRIVSYFQRNGHTAAQIGTPKWRELARALANAELEALRRVAERDEGDFTGAPSNPLLVETPSTPTDALSARILSDQSTQTLSELSPAFLAERRASPAMQNEHGVSVRMFEEFLDQPTPVYKISRKDVQAYKRALADTPANYRKRFPGMTLPDAIKANARRADPFPALDPKTINDKWLSRLHAILNWCVRNDILPDNPAAGIKVEYQRDKGKPARMHFSPGDLSKIFAKPFFSPAKPMGETHWAMLLSLFAGTRPSELAQVELDHIQHMRGALVFSIEGETKNLGSRRLIPVHQTLLDLGLDRRITDLRKAGATHLFPDWYRKGQAAKARADARTKASGQLPSINQHYPKYLPKHVNVIYLTKVKVKEPGKDFYSFRHTFKTGLALAGVEKSIRDYLCGHNDHSAGSVYIHDVSIEAMNEAVQKLHFDGLDLSDLISPAH